METNDFLKTYSKLWLQSKREVLWGQAFDLTDEGRLDQAAEFLAHAIQGVNDIAAGGTK